LKGGTKGVFPFRSNIFERKFLLPLESCHLGKNSLTPGLDFQGTFLGNIVRQNAVFYRVTKPIQPVFQVVQLLLQCLQMLVML
jgi:hypothetical protein